MESAMRSIRKFCHLWVQDSGCQAYAVRFTAKGAGSRVGSGWRATVACGGEKLNDRLKKRLEFWVMEGIDRPSLNLCGRLLAF